jgi:uncharacterized membrane protein YraQ (UPF0718 family)
MAEAHHHAEDRSTYYLDQLFTIGVCGAIAAVTLMLWQSNLLGRMLHPKFHVWVVGGGFSLLGLVLLRAVAVWRSVDETQPTPHEHGPECDHSHGHGHGHEEECGHTHGHGHEHVQAGPGGAPSLALAGVGAPAAPVAHSHAHGHSHSHAGHEHGWAPWRYVVLLLPVVLYFLVLSNPGFDKEPVAVPSNPLDHIQNFIIIFRSILWEAMPFIVLGSVIAGMLEELLPQRVLVSLLPRNRFLAVAMGGLLGLVFPMCECGIIPIMRRLLRKGLPLSCCISYLLAGPIVNVVVLLSTVAAFSGMENVYEGGEPSYQMGSFYMTAFRAGLGYVIAVVTAMVVEWQYRKHGNSLLTPLTRPSALPLVEEDAPAERRPLWQRVSNITETALHDFVDITVFLILGALLAATTRIFLTPDRIAGLSREHVVLAIALMMSLAVVLCLCSEADAFVAASFVTMRPSAKLAFLVLGPMLDFKLYFMYTRIFRPRLIFTIYSCVLAQVFLFSLGVHFFWEKYAPQLITPVKAEAPTISEEEMKSVTVKAVQTVGLLAPFGPGASTQVSAITGVSMLLINPNEQISEITFLQLENASMTPELRNFYSGRRVRLVGRFVEARGGFTLVRYKINCCAADATPLQAAILVRPEQSLPTNKLRDQWVRVTGRVQFYQTPNGAFHTAVIVTPTEREPLDKVIEPVPPDPNPFVY